jgi:ribosome biogenesis GTPase
VGKSTLINRLCGAEVQATGAIREDDDRGRHTTTARQLIPLPGGALVIDTPGMRELQLWEGDQGLQATFPEIEELAAACRFRDCTHAEEPGCAVREALTEGRLAEDRFESFLRLRRELAYLARKEDQRAAAAEREKWKKINREFRQRGIR